MRESDDDGVDESTADGIDRRTTTSRRAFLAVGGTAAAGALAGCNTPGVLGNEDSGAVTISDFRGSGPLVESRDAPGGTPISELPDLSGELSLYLGGGEGGLYLDLIELFEKIYPEFTVRHKLQPSSDLANTIIEETKAGVSPADVFISIDAGSLGAVAEAGATVTLPDSVLEPVPSSFRSGDGQWVGVAGRARSVPYNTNALSASDIPDSVQAFPETPALKNAMGWAPSYGAFQSFITAMRLIRGDEKTKAWLRAMMDHGISTYPDEFRVSNAVADGEIKAGFANHYYALRVRSGRPDAPLDLAFTKDDAGALVNVSGGAIVKGTDNRELAGNFIRHLLSSEAQEFFATRTFAYPMIPGVPPVGGLPRIDELNPPDIDLTKLSDIAGTLELLREAGAL